MSEENKNEVVEKEDVEVTESQQSDELQKIKEEIDDVTDRYKRVLA